MYEDTRNVKCVEPGMECCEQKITMKDNAVELRKILIETRYRAKSTREKLLGPEQTKDGAVDKEPGCLMEELVQAKQIAWEVLHIMDVIDGIIC